MNVTCLYSFNCVTKLCDVLYKWHLLVLAPYVVRLCIDICSVSCIIHTHVMHAWSFKGYIHTIHACDLRLFLNMLVYKQVIINVIVDSSKML